MSEQETRDERAEQAPPTGTSSTEGGAAGAAPQGTGGSESSGSGARRRRRGSRGGRNRRPSAASGAAPSSGGARSDAAAGAASGNGGARRAGREDWQDPAADRGLTSDDVAGRAAEEAGVAEPRIGDTRPAPKIGDTRPAPPTPEGGAAPAKKRRRRRGGRGRSKGGDQGGRPSGPAAGGGAARSPEFVDGALAVGDTDVDGTAILDQLDDATLARRMGQTRKGRPAGRYLMVAHVGPDGTSHLAVLEGRSLVEYYVSRPSDDDTSIDGNIYLGKVENVLPGMEAAFVDIGTPKNAVLYRSDVSYDASEFDGERPRIERLLRNGQSILVQVTKNPIGHKGARLTQEVSLAGRFVVMVPGQPETYGISKRLPDDERKRLRRVLDRLKPADAGLIVRTAADGATEEELERDLRRLRDQWEQIESLAARSRPGSLLYKEPALVVRVIREELNKEYRGIVIDDADLFEEVSGYLGAVAPELADRVERYEPEVENLPVFERFHVHEQLHKALDRKVWLPSGGSLVIERTEALTVIDVNTGKNVGRSNLEETVYKNNLEAAEAVARELRLRDIGGIIVIDFIDMDDESNRRDVEQAFREALARDKTRTQAFPISELGLLEMTRKRISEGLVEAFSTTCEVCVGRGFVVEESLLS